MAPGSRLWHDAPMAGSRMGRQITEVLAALDKAQATAALIGGLALAPHGVVRATQDVDLLTDSTEADAVHRELLALGYRCVHRSADAGNYVRGDERVDLLYARRPPARHLLTTATAHATPFGRLRVIHGRPDRVRCRHWSTTRAGRRLKTSGPCYESTVMI